MGFDVSYHPVDLPLIESRILPFVQGQGSIDDLVDRAVRIAKVRFRANAWGLGSQKNKRVVSDLHIWGRPFFITEEAPDAVSTAVDGWLDATESDADALARGMLQRLGINGSA